MDTETTAIAITAGASAIGALAKPILRAAFPGKRITQAAIQPFALAAVAGVILGWHASLPGPMDPWTIVPQVALGWVFANSRPIGKAVVAKKREKDEVPKP